MLEIFFYQTQTNSVCHFTVGLGYELQHAFKGIIENSASMNNVHLRVDYTF